ncbi:MAG: HEAT repeat domain-containing protein, partial [Acidobacteriota bacterium]
MLVTLLSIPQPVLAQMLAQVTRIDRRSAQPKKPLRSDQIAAAIGDLLKERPFDALPLNEEENKTDGKDDQEKPPADDAPIEKLIAYWSIRGYSDFEDAAPKPSDKVRERLLETFENRPWLSPGLFNLFPETSDAYDRLHRLLNEDPNEQANWKNIIRQKLKHESSYFRDELLNEVRNFGKFNYSDVSSLRALIKLDWDAAKPFVEQMAGNALPHIAAESQVLIYEQACRTNDSSQAEALRAQLKAIVANRLIPAAARQSAVDSLMGTEWGGRDEWYVSLFADTSLSGVRLEEKKADDKQKTDSGAGLNRVFRPQMMDEDRGQNSLWTSLLTNASKLVPVVLNLVGNGDRAVHLAAVSCLTQFLNTQNGAKEQRIQIARALLPWLIQPDWGGEMDRWSFIESLTNLDLPESVPGLIWVLDNDETAENRAVAAGALVKYKNPQVIPSLRRALNRDGEAVMRAGIIAALAELGGFSDAEAAAAIEAYARRILTEEGERE